MTEKEKRDAGLIYNANYDEELEREMLETQDKCFLYNQILPSKKRERDEQMRKILGKTKNNFEIRSPFHCDYGYNIEIGENFYANHNCVILDGAKVTFGDNVFIAPDCGFYTAGHPLDKKQRSEGLEYAYPITVGNDVWFGAGVRVMPGVTIGSNVVIGAGSVVTKDIPDNVVAAGNPCRVIREIEQ
ncbi:MAG: sugar O-acetyltransferase [Ruminococcus sp.]|jgi:maltose O-acetyltransferase